VLSGDELDELFDDCVELDSDARLRRIDSVAERDPSLAAELKSLLAAHDAAPTFLDGPPVGGVSSTQPVVGDEVGGYRLLEPLGEGGMGAVFLAEKSDLSIEHRVALKIVRGGLLAPRLAARIHEEQRILAMLNHPNIARLYDAGIDDNGSPYLVMEHVEGTPLIEYCDERQLPIDRRLDIFRDLCSAVHYAHQRLVVHRDLKPSNILVKADGTPKLLDFGIAKLVERGDEETTQTALQAMTPTYASPEHEQILGEQITTATDVYGLGIILYELLTGTRPHVEPGRPRHEIERRVCEEDPIAPSNRTEARLPNARGEGRAPAVDRSTTPERLRRRLHGELDNITLKALRRAPSDRYRSAEFVKQDLERYKNHQPVHAQPQTVRYRMSRFLRRHRAGAVASLLVALALAFSFVSIVEGRRRAELEADKANEIAGFLTRLFEYVNPDAVATSAATVHDLLDEGAVRVETELAAQPRVRAELQRVMARAYMATGRFEAAESLATASVDTLRSVSDSDLDLARSLHSQALVLRERADLVGGEAAARESLEIRRRVHGRDHKEVAESLSVVGNLVIGMGDPEGRKEAVGIYREALEIYAAAVSEPDQELARMKNNLGMVLSQEGQFEEAEEHLRGALEIEEKLFEQEHPDTARAINNLAILLRRMGRMEEAGEQYRRSLEMRRSLHPDGHPSVAQSINNLGAFHYANGELDRAEELFAEALDMWRPYLPDDHPQLAAVRTNLSSLARTQGDFERARGLVDLALTGYRSHFGDRHPRTTDAVYRLGVLDNAEGHHRAALEHLKVAYEIQKADQGAAHRATARTVLAMGTAELGLGRTEAAERSLKSALEFFVSTEDKLADECRERLVELYEAKGESERAAAYRRSD